MWRRPSSFAFDRLQPQSGAAQLGSTQAAQLESMNYLSEAARTISNHVSGDCTELIHCFLRKRLLMHRLRRPLCAR